MIIFSALYGVIAAVGVLVVQVPFGTVPLLVGVIMEELAKAIAIVAGRATTARGALMHALGVTLGFIAIEHALIALVPYNTNVFASGATIGTIIIHLSTLLLYAVAARHHWSAMIVALVLGNSLHAAYNISATTAHSSMIITTLVAAAFLAITCIAALLRPRT